MSCCFSRWQSNIGPTSQVNCCCRRNFDCNCCIKFKVRSLVGSCHLCIMGRFHLFHSAEGFVAKAMASAPKVLEAHRWNAGGTIAAKDAVDQRHSPHLEFQVTAILGLDIDHQVPKAIVWERYQQDSISQSYTSSVSLFLFNFKINRSSEDGMDWEGSFSWWCHGCPQQAPILSPNPIANHEVVMYAPAVWDIIHRYGQLIVRYYTASKNIKSTNYTARR